MAETEKLPPEALEAIAGKIRARLVDTTHHDLITEAAADLNTAGKPKSNLAEVGETLKVWTLGTDDVERFKQAGSDLKELAHETERWHHQVKFAGIAKAFARTMQLDESDADWSVRELFVSPLAALINSAITLADKEVDDNKKVHLLSVPAYQVQALWFVDKVPDGEESQVLIVSAPEHFAELQPGRFLSSHEFLNALANESFIVGLR